MGIYRHDQYGNQEGGCVRYRIFLTVLLVINTFTFCLITIWTYKFVRVFGIKKKLQLVFLLLVCLSAIGRIVFFSLELAYRKGTCYDPPPACLEGSIHWLNAALLTSAVISNIFNWLYQRLRLDKLRTGVRRQQFGYHLALILTLSLELVLYLGLILLSCAIHGEPHAILQIFGYIYASTFILIGIVFAFVGYIFYRKFKISSPENARKIKNRVIMSVIIIFTSFVIRGINNFIVIILDGEETMRLQWLENDSVPIAVLLSLYFITVDVVPSVYLSYTIKVITQEYKNRHKTRYSKNTSFFRKQLSFGEVQHDLVDENSESYETSKETLDKSKASLQMRGDSFSDIN
ncbi:unnamed protein product [Moneuplotes crassus]|uniref:THH1/TOM1/TOM3 domain-containing protein n=1 Tax=Euplotes crassus TaxID=5936 RepID=A0AAD1XIK4_EUPCR|nr:unnamed protein product [Moneuplotes crassus]